MFVHYRTKGLILKKDNLREADQSFTIFTKDFGKIDVLGKGIRKVPSKLRAGIEAFYFSEIEFIQGKIYKILTDAVLIDKFKNLRKSLKKLNIAYKISELLGDLIYRQESEKRIFDLLLKTFQKLDKSDLDTKEPELIYYYFFWKLILILGYGPELHQCVVCQRTLKPEKLYLNSQEGGIICQNCFLKVKLGKEISPEIIKILRIILERDWKTVFRIKTERKHLKLLKEASRDYLSFVSENNLN